LTARFALPVFAALLPLLALAACPGDAAIAAYVAEFRAATVSKGFGKDITLADAKCARAKLIEALPKVLGERVGYKAVFVTPESQQRFGVSGPAWGAMFSAYMLRDSTLVPARLGASLRYEAGLVVVVKDAGLAEAGSTLEALEHISDLIPFIELPDAMLEGAPTGAELIAINAAFRGGVLGARIPVVPGRALLDALAEMEVVVGEERSGHEVGRAQGKVLMGQPIRAALWLARALQKDGIELKAGDLLSLGGFLEPMPIRPRTSISVRYLGLPDNPTVEVHFE
jgi:2-keto-4-pentenoate hydratase